MGLNVYVSYSDGYVGLFSVQQNKSLIYLDGCIGGPPIEILWMDQIFFCYVIDIFSEQEITFLLGNWLGNNLIAHHMVEAVVFARC